VVIVARIRFIFVFRLSISAVPVGHIGHGGTTGGTGHEGHGIGAGHGVSAAASGALCVGALCVGALCVGLGLEGLPPISTVWSHF
jgi:hypothetical protein